MSNEKKKMPPIQTSTPHATSLANDERKVDLHEHLGEVVARNNDGRSHAPDRPRTGHAPTTPWPGSAEHGGADSEDDPADTDNEQ